jgi:type 1 glutamine amidotransferase
MRDAAKRFAGVVWCLVATAACGSGGTAANRAEASAGAGGSDASSQASTIDAAVEPREDASAGSTDVVEAPPDVVGAPPDVVEAPPDAVEAPATKLAANVLIFTRSTNAYVHESKLPAAMAIKTALAALGVTSTLSEDTTLFTTAGLAPFGAIVLVDTTGKPLGDPGTAQQDALEAFVKAGGGLVGVHAATATSYGATSPYVALLGGLFVDHPGDVHDSTCFPSGAHPAVAQLPASFAIRDEIFRLSNRRADSTVVVECLATDGKTRLPIAWHHVEGAGRVFDTALGHPLELWTADGLLLTKHVIPAILWTLGR